MRSPFISVKGILALLLSFALIAGCDDGVVEPPIEQEEEISVTPEPVRAEVPPAEEETPPSKEEETPPADDDETPAGDDETPAGDEETPAGDEEVPTGDEETPTGDEEAPAGDEETPTEGEEPPLEDDEVPDDGDEVPDDGGEVPDEPEPPVDPSVSLSLDGKTVSFSPGGVETEIAEDLNALFSVPSDGVASIKYFFCEEIAAMTTIGEQDVKFSVSDDGIRLYAALNDGDEQMVAYISNTSSANIFGYVRGAVADALMNTGGMYVLIKADALLDSGTSVGVTFDGADHFRADIKRPVEIASISSESLVDGVDFGEKGSYISISDLLAPVDWRGRTFEDYPNYWGYYGIRLGSDPNVYGFEVVLDTGDVQCEISGKRQSLLAGMYISQIDPAKTNKSADGKYFLVPDPVRPSRSVQIPANKFGYLTYFNNGRILTQDFRILVKGTVHYGFGYLKTDWIAIPVKKTEN